jgi:hypothetical protein
MQNAELNSSADTSSHLNIGIYDEKPVFKQ